MRSLRKSWIGLVLIILFGSSLFFWRQSSYISNVFNSDNVIAKVGNTPISTTRFNRALQMNIQQFNDILSKELKREEIKNYQIPQLSLGAIVNETVFENEFNNLNFKLDKTIIAKKTQEVLPRLYNEKNELNESYLKQFSLEQGLKIEDIVQISHYDARNDYFNSALLNINFPSSFSNKIETYNNHIRDIEYLKIPMKLINISEELKANKNDLDNVLIKYYENYLHKFMSEEKRDIEYILVDKKNLINNFIPTENEVKEYYNNNSDIYYVNEQRDFLQFNFKTNNEAENFKKIIENFKTYKEIKSYADINNIEYNIFENLSHNEVLEEISQYIFTLNINEQSPIIKTPIAYHIVILKNINPEKKLSFKESEIEIIKTISNNDVDNFLIDLENNISQDILESLTLRDIAKKNGLKVSFINNISINYDEFEKNNEQFYNNIIENAFNSNLNFNSDIIKLNKDKFYIFEVVNIKESLPLNFLDIKNEVLDSWKVFKQTEKIELEIKNNNKKLDFLKDLERKFGNNIKDLSITSLNNKIPKEVTTEVFKSDVNSISYKIIENEVHIFKLLKINIKEKSNAALERISLNNEIRNILFTELLQNTKISTNEQMINAILNNY